MTKYACTCMYSFQKTISEWGLKKIKMISNIAFKETIEKQKSI